MKINTNYLINFDCFPHYIFNIGDTESLSITIITKNHSRLEGSVAAPKRQN